MIPDFPVQKAKLFEGWTRYCEKKQREYMGFVGEISAYAHREGSQWRIERTDGSESTSDYESVSSGLMFDVAEVPELTPDKIAQKLDSLAKDMADQVQKHVFETIVESSTESGRIIDAEQRPFDKELLLKLFDSVETDFDEYGNPTSGTLVVSPAMWNAVKDEIRQWEQDPEFSARHRQIIERKRENWRVRESNRKLVD